METKAMRARRLSRAIQGFTLVELLAAISILAMVAILGWRGLDGILRARAALSAELEQTRGMQLTFAQLQSDCLQLASSALLGARRPLAVQTNRLVLARTVFSDRRPSQLQIVDYRLRNGMLTRRESPQTRDLNIFDGLWKAELSDVADDAQAGRAIILQSHLDSMRIRLWNSGESGWRGGVGAGFDNVSSTGISPQWIGLEISLQPERPAQQAPGNVVKAFLLGGA